MFEVEGIKREMTFGESGSSDCRIAVDTTRPNGAQDRLLIDSWHAIQLNIAGSICGIVLKSALDLEEQAEVFDTVLAQTTEVPAEYGDMDRDRRIIAGGLAHELRMPGLLFGQHLRVAGDRRCFFEVKERPDGLTLGNTEQEAVLVPSDVIPDLLIVYMGVRQGYRCKQAVILGKDTVRAQREHPGKDLYRSVQTVRERQ